MKNFIFDLYNTLIEVRTDEHCERAWTPVVKYFAECGVPSADWHRLVELFDAYWDEFNNLAAKSEYAYPECDCVEQFMSMAKSLGGALTREQATHALRLMREASTELLRPFDGVKELFAELKKAGAKLYLLSNAQAAFTYDEIAKCGLGRAFDGLLLSSECGCRKPDPAFFNMLFDKYKLDKSKCVMIGDDRTSDGEGAAAAGIMYVFAGGGAPKVKDELLRLAREK